jgi:hypothetical protein
MARFKPLTLLLAAIVAVSMLAGVASVGEPEQVNAPKILITDVGQGNTAKIIRMLMKKNGISDFKLVEIAAPEDLEGVEMMIVGVGASTKGLGAAGLNLEQEKQRAARLLATARERSVKVVGAHLGGKARRGEISDTLNELVMMESDTFVVWQEGNEDGFFTRLARARLGDSPDEGALADLLRVVESKIAVGTELKGIIEFSL